MASRFQKKSFPVSQLGRMKILTVEPNGSGVQVEMPYQSLKLVVINNQLCFLHKDASGDLIMPIARYTHILKLFAEGVSYEE